MTLKKKNREFNNVENKHEKIKKNDNKKRKKTNDWFQKFDNNVMIVDLDNNSEKRKFKCKYWYFWNDENNNWS